MPPRMASKPVAVADERGHPARLSRSGQRRSGYPRDGSRKGRAAASLPLPSFGDDQTRAGSGSGSGTRLKDRMKSTALLACAAALKMNLLSPFILSSQPCR